MEKGLFSASCGIHHLEYNFSLNLFAGQKVTGRTVFSKLMFYFWCFANARNGNGFLMASKAGFFADEHLMWSRFPVRKNISKLWWGCFRIFTFDVHFNTVKYKINISKSNETDYNK